MIAVLIPAKNEAHNLTELLPLLAFAAEIIIVNHQSTDQTAEIAKKHGAKVVDFSGLSFSEMKNVGLKAVTRPWTLWLDADERPDQAFIDEMIGRISNTTADAFQIRRVSYFCGQKVRFSGWQHDVVLRLFRTSKVSFPDQMVHEKAVVQGRIEDLKGLIHHHTARSLEQYRQKIEHYSRLKAMAWHQEGKQTPWFAGLKPSVRFLKHYVWKLGFLDGWAGWHIAQCAAMEVRLRYRFLDALNEKGR